MPMSEPQNPLSGFASYVNVQLKTPSSDEKETDCGKLASLFKHEVSYNQSALIRSYNRADAISGEGLEEKVAGLRKELLGNKDDVEKIEKVIEENVDLFRRYSDDSAIFQLVNQLCHFPSLAMEAICSFRDLFVESIG